MNDIQTVFFLGQDTHGRALVVPKTIHDIHASRQELLDYQHRPAGDPSLQRAQRFEHTIRDTILSNNHNALTHCLSLSEDAQLSCPTPEHYLPLLYIMALQTKDGSVGFPVQGIDGGPVPVLSVRIKK